MIVTAERFSWNRHLRTSEFSFFTLLSEQSCFFTSFEMLERSCCNLVTAVKTVHENSHRLLFSIFYLVKYKNNYNKNTKTHVIIAFIFLIS